MELSWLTRIKVTAVLALGIVVWGVFIWHFVAPDDPMGIVTLVGGHVKAAHIGMTILIAFCAGFFAYFLGWPYGREIGILAVPAGLAAWAARSGDMAEFMQTHTAVPQRAGFYRSIGWEGFAWLAIVAAGYAGAQIAAALIPSGGVLPEFEPQKTRPKMNWQSVVAIAAAALIGTWCMFLFARNVSFPDKSVGSVLGQPANAQIDFAAMLSFGIAAFVAKKVWDASYVWPAIATAIVAYGSMNLCGRQDTLSYMAANWPAAFFSKAFCAVLPVQIVAFGVIGSIVGYWLAVRFKYWQQHHD
jgi:hypothetical protein